ncbi:MAG TPA: alpha/beta hydrolase [Acidimicrobiales bacterium]|nr:alpha/beta hydrolase [Acidimicrobiales bacterium]
MSEEPTIVLVHGAFADASGFAGLIRELEAAGRTVVAIPNPLRGLASDAESIATQVKAIDGPVVLVGHSYAGAPMGQASAELSNVKALVFLAALGLDVGESVAGVQEPFPPPLVVKTSYLTQYDAPGAAGGPELYIEKDRFHETFCADAPVDVADVMAVSQRPVAGAALQEPATAAGWKTIPSWYLVSEQDNGVSPEAQKFMANRMKATTESIDGPHAAFVAQPVRVAEFIQKACSSASNTDGAGTAGRHWWAHHSRV